MATIDWYRRKTWTKTDEEEYFQKLNRARKDSRPQYLKIQALELIATDAIELLLVAESLLIKLLEDYPDDRFNRSSTLNALGSISEKRGNHLKAMLFYKQSLDFEEIYPNVITQSYISYSEMVIVTNSIEHYDKVEKILEQKLPTELFPISKYKIALILSIINKANSNSEKEIYYKSIAEQNANAETTGLRYHQFLGLVEKRSDLESYL